MRVRKCTPKLQQFKEQQRLSKIKFPTRKKEEKALDGNENHDEVTTIHRFKAKKTIQNRSKDLSSLKQKPRGRPKSNRARKPDEARFCCTFCNKKFTRVANLERHVRSHTGEKPHSCDVCGRRFNDKANMNKHRRLHTGERPHQCERCDRRFSTAGNLRSHFRTHTGEKPYKCDICGDAFTQAVSCRLHKRKHDKNYTSQSRQTGWSNFSPEEWSIEITPTPMNILRVDFE